MYICICIYILNFALPWGAAAPQTPSLILGSLPPQKLGGCFPAAKINMKYQTKASYV